MDGARAAIDKGACVGRVFKDLQDGCCRGPLPNQIAEAIAPRQQEVVVIEKRQHFTRRAFLQKSGEDELQAIMHLVMRVLMHASSRITHEANRQCQREFAATSLVQQSGGQACSNGMQFQFGELSL